MNCLHVACTAQQLSGHKSTCRTFISNYINIIEGGSVKVCVKISGVDIQTVRYSKATKGVKFPATFICWDVFQAMLNTKLRKLCRYEYYEHVTKRIYREARCARRANGYSAI